MFKLFQTSGIAMRNLWTSTHSNTEILNALVLKIKAYDSSTYRGKTIREGFLLQMLKDSGKSLGFRGMSREQILKPTSRLLLGLIGNAQFIIFNKDGSVDEKTTRKAHGWHLHGDVRGVSTTESLFIGLTFAEFFMPKDTSKNKLIIIVDYNNIPSHLIRDTKTLFKSLEPKEERPPALQRVEILAGEQERTLQDAPAWSIVGALSRVGKSLKCDWNPFYIDKVVLQKHSELKEKFDALEKEFFLTCQWVRKSHDDPRVADTMLHIRQFYQEYAEAISMDKGQVIDIMKTLDLYEEQATLMASPAKKI